MSRTLRPCGHSGCPQLVNGSRCKKHERAEHRRDRHKRGSAASRGYDRKHQRWRARILARDPLCVMCLAEGRVTASTVADHVVPLADGGARFDMGNGQGLCGTCHNRKTAGERG